jgi:hypothetical protein
MHSLRKTAARFGDMLLESDPLDLVIRATLLLFAGMPSILGVEWQYQLIIRGLAVIGILAPVAGRSAAFWWAMATIFFVKSVDHWWIQDNHLFLLNWWCLTLALALSTADPRRIIAANARLLIGLSFFFAVLWKGFLSPDYMRGDYFHFTFLTDSRVSGIGTLLCGMDPLQYRHNYDAMGLLASYKAEVQSVQLQGTPVLRMLAVVVTWWTILIEGALALLFLLPSKFRWTRGRNVALLLFAWTTYLAMPIVTFGWTLITLGLAQCDDRARRTRLCYILTYPLLLAYLLAPIWPILNRAASALLAGSLVGTP